MFKEEEGKTLVVFSKHYFLTFLINSEDWFTESKNLRCGSLVFAYLGFRQEKKRISDVLLSNFWVWRFRFHQHLKGRSSCPSSAQLLLELPTKPQTVNEEGGARVTTGDTVNSENKDKPFPPYTYVIQQWLEKSQTLCWHGPQKEAVCLKGG